MPEGATPANSSNRTSSMRASRVAKDGLVAGLLGAFVVAFAHGIADLTTGQILHTPTVLGALLFDGLAAAQRAGSDPQLAFQFTCLHVVVWVLLATVGSLMISVVDTRPKLASIVFAGTAFVLISLSYLAGAFSVPGLAPMHLWTGSLAGSAAAAAYLSWRHPKLASHLERVNLTATTRAEIERALALEASGSAAFELSAAAFPESPLANVLNEKQGHVYILSKLTKDLGLAAPSDAAPAWQPSTLDDTLRAAIAHERDLVDLYDRFLVAVPEIHIREVFLRLRFHAIGSTLVQLQAALSGSDDSTP